MIKYFCISVFLFLLQPLYLNAQIWVVDPLEALYPDSNNVNSLSNEWSADFIPASEIAAHLLVKVPENTNFTLTAKIGNRQLSNEVFSKLIDVPVEQNTGIDSRTEMYKGEHNPYVIRKAPFRIFEVIQPLAGSVFSGTANYQAFRFNLPKEFKTKGKLQVRFQLTFKESKFTGGFRPYIYPIVIPTASESHFFYTNWFNLSKMEYHHGVDRWSKPWFVMLDKYAKIMAHGRQNAILIPAELIFLKNDTITLAEDKMWNFIQVFRNNGFRYFESPHLMNRGPNDDWGDPELKVALTGRRYNTEGGKVDIARIMTLFRDFALKYDLVNNWLQHISDEPTSVNAACYREIAKQVKQIFPQVKIMEATNDRENLAGAIDIWCPIINDFQENESFFRSREKLGEQILVYTCLVPGGKWLNRTLDMEKLRQVYFGWGASHYNTNGYLHWGLNQYQANPYDKSVVKHPSPAAGANNYLPAGDTHIIYPGKDGPLSSLRFEAHRTGIEDYEMLQQLRLKDKEAYERLMNRLFRSYTDYNLSIKDYREVKKEMLEILSSVK